MIAGSTDQATARTRSTSRREISQARRSSPLAKLDDGSEVPSHRTSRSAGTGTTNDKSGRGSGRSKTPVKTKRHSITIADAALRHDFLDGWGDFDSDRLLRAKPSLDELDDQASVVMDDDYGKHGGDDSPIKIKSTEEDVSSRTRPRSRLSTNGGSRRRDVETPSSVQRFPLQPHSLAAVDLDPELSGPPSATGVALQPRKRLTAQPKSKRRVEYEGLFGKNIVETAETRAMIFARLGLLWATLDSSGQSPHKSVSECAGVLLRLCQAVGTPLCASSMWQGRDSVSIEMFCEGLIRSVIQPAMQQIKLDRSIDEYVQALDVVIQGVVENTSRQGEDPVNNSWRLRELQDIRPVPPFGWAEMSPNVSAPRQGGTRDATTLSSAFCRISVPSPVARLEGGGAKSALPANEASVQHDANIQRKLQLRQSWQPRVLVVHDPLDGRASIKTPLQGVSGHSTVIPVSGKLNVSSNNRDDTVIPTCTSIPDPTSSSPPFETKGDSHGKVQRRHKDNSSAMKRVSEPQDAEMDDRMLLCGGCVDAEAVLWCASCFNVYCPTCWTTVHDTIVDSDALEHHQELFSTLTARPLRRTADTSASRDDALPHPPLPSMPLVYLPTRAKALRGKRFRRHVPQCRRLEVDNDDSPDDPALEPSDEHLAVLSSAILPELKPAPQRQFPDKRPVDMTKPPKKTENVESTANLVKALMLGSVSPMPSSSLASSSTKSSLNSVESSNLKPRKLIAKRKVVPTAQITFSADALLP